MVKGLIVDNFAGGGGASTGIEMALGRSVDIAINHDPDAIAMHQANHPNTRHYCENVWDIDPVDVCGGEPVALAWFSPDCKHFSRAKAGKPVDKNIRGLAWVAIRWAMTVRPAVIMLENVSEIKTWCPLGVDNKPIKARIGETFDGFVRILSTGLPKDHPAFAECCAALGIDMDSDAADKLSGGLGYAVEHRELVSCDYGAPTTRKRFYMIARCDGNPIVWPVATHAPKDSAEVKAGAKLPYRTAADCIDWTIPTTSIFERKKPLSENTLRRIAKGIKKFIIDNPEPFVIEGKAPVLRYAISVAHIMKNYAGGYTGNGSAATDPLDTVTAKDHNSLVTTHIMTLRNHMDGQALEDNPLTIVATSGAHHAEVQTFLVKYYGTSIAQAADAPLGTVTTKDRFAIVNVHGVDYAITDIRMRMLQPRELFNAQGFPPDYIIDHDASGKPYPKSKQVARCGNAVTPPVAAALVRANF